MDGKLKLNDILGLTQEELSVVPDILSHYLDIVGEAELIPNYVNLKQCVNEIYS